MAGRAVLSAFIVYRATLCAISRHYVSPNSLCELTPVLSSHEIAEANRSFAEASLESAAAHRPYATQDYYEDDVEDDDGQT
jgi:hypothetical protein